MIQKYNQLTLADQLFHPEKQNTKTTAFLAWMENVIEWIPLVKIVADLDQKWHHKRWTATTQSSDDGQSLFLQHFYGLSALKREEQLNGSLSFQLFVVCYKATKLRISSAFEGEGAVRLVLLQILEDRYGKKSTVIASQLLVGQWYEYLKDATLADAILHRLTARANRIELLGNSLRTKE